jgi:hypothetical protein
MSDMFSSYVAVNKKHTIANDKALRGMHKKHSWVNHSKHYVDPVTGAHKNRIEGT